MEERESGESGEKIEYERGLTFEKVWAYMQEGYRQERLEREARERKWELEREAARLAREEWELERERKREEWERQANERFAKTERFLAEIGRQIGGVHRGFGELAEHLVCPGIASRFNELGFHFENKPESNIVITDEKKRKLSEIDLLLENEEVMIAVEVKTRPTEEDIVHHVRRMGIIRADNDKRQDRRKLLGAVAGAIFYDDIKELVRNAGFFAVEQSGDTMRIDAPPGFKAKEW